MTRSFVGSFVRRSDCRKLEFHSASVSIEAAAAAAAAWLRDHVDAML